MNRLIYSNGGFFRAMQISSTKLFVFVEGIESDPFFYSKICEGIPELNQSYSIYYSKQLPGNSGGKQSLMNFFSYLRLRKGLVSTLKGKSTYSIFFVDKDVDDIIGIKKRSKHIVYTEFYDVQNYIYLYGNLMIGAASAASVDPRKLKSALSDSEKWCKRSAEYWKDWLILCLYMRINCINCVANYRTLSTIQQRHYGPTRNDKYKQLKSTIAATSGISSDELESRLAIISTKVNSYFKKNLHHKIFKGKWFSHILADTIDQIISPDDYDKNNLVNRLPCSITATLNFEASWADHFRNSIKRILIN